MRAADFRRALMSVAYAADLNEQEVNQITYRLPMDAFNRVLYNGLPDVLQTVKFSNFKHMVVEAQGSVVQKKLFDLCRQEESRIAHEQDGVEVGVLSNEALSHVLGRSGANLSRLQICVLLAGSTQSGSHEVDYHQFVPVAAKAIEYMFEPKALRQRAELIEKTDLSSEHLVDVLATQGVEELAIAMRGLFDSCDVNHSGTINLPEFVLLMRALEFELKDEEIEAYFYIIPLKVQDEIAFDEILQFLKDNLTDLQRKKQNRILASSLHSTSIGVDTHNPQNKEQIQEQTKMLRERLASIFKLSDEEATGFLTNHEFQKLLEGLDLGYVAGVILT